MRIISLILIAIISSFSTFAQSGIIEISVGGTTSRININSIDSITYENNGSSISHIFWKNGDSFSQQITKGDSLKLISPSPSYTTFTDPTHGITNGILFDDGLYGLAMNNENNHRKILIFGNSLLLENILVAELDEFNMIRKICIGDDFYTIKYLESKAIVNYVNKLTPNSINEFDVPYTKFYSSDGSSKVISRTTTTTDNQWFRAAQILDGFIGLKNMDASTYLSSLLQIQNNKNFEDASRVTGFLGSILTLNPLGIGIGLLDMHDLIGERIHYGGASIETGDAKVINCNNATISAIINNFSQINLNGYELDCSMEIWNEDNDGFIQTKNNISIDTELIFDFNGLDFNTIYNYQAALNLYYYDILYNPNISISDLFFSNPAPMPIQPSRMKLADYLKGNIKFLKTSSPSCVIEYFSDNTYQSINVHCSFSNLPKGSTCGVYIWEDNGSHIPYSGSSSNESQVINVHGLKASTQYNCQAYVNANGVLFLSKQIETFKTEDIIPDVVGTWSVTEYNADGSVYETFTVTLNEGGTANAIENNPGLFEGECSGNWSFKNNTLNISLLYYNYIDPYTQASSKAGKNLSGIIDNVYKPSQIEGTSTWFRLHSFGGNAQYNNRMIMNRMD